MRETSTELLVELPATYNTSQLLIDRLGRGGVTPLYTVKRGSDWVDVSTAGFVAAVRRAAKALLAAGVRPGDAVAIMSRTRYEWALAEQAIWFAGALSVPIYETSSPYQVEWILRDSGARYLFAENQRQREVAEAAVKQLGEPVQIWVFDEHGDPDAAAPIPSAGLGALLAAGDCAPVSDAHLETARLSRRLHDVATLVYTSGTTGRPKGCRITHANFALVAVNIGAHMPEVLGTNQRTLTFLPLAHVLARAVQQVCVQAGTTVAHSATPATLIDDLAAVRPDFLLAVPRVFEKIRATALAKAEAGGKAKLFETAEAVAIASSRAADVRARGGALGFDPVLWARHAFFDRLLYPKLRAVLGGKASYTISGASALNPDLAHFFRGAGLGLLEGYGLTETTAPATVNTARAARVGSVGVPIPGTSIRIADDGEVLVKGIGVFAGYHSHPEASAAAFTTDGFFRTGDTGSLDDDGFLVITGRKKDILVTAGGKNVAPEPLEELVRASRLVSQIVLVGENRPFIAALITLDAEALIPWATAHSLTGLNVRAAATHPLVLAELQRAVDAANATVSAAESIKKFLVLDEDFTEESGHLTPSLKLRRQAVTSTFEARIAELYGR